jgi:hypothetical protein
MSRLVNGSASVVLSLSSVFPKPCAAAVNPLEWQPEFAA